MTTSKTATAAKANTESADPEISALERPKAAGVNTAGFGSDVVAETLRDLDIPYIALNPGASYRGLHDSIVNYLGNKTPQMLLCLHEEAAVAIAHGYAKVTGKAMAAAVHSNVGLFHATMAMFNAWCDRSPVIVLGATGPVDAMKRRPWIDWIHTSADQGAIVRDFTKWDDQPASPGAARESILRASWMANTFPQGPVYINLDAEMQEAKLAEPLPPINVAKFMPETASTAPANLVKAAAEKLMAAKNPVMLIGRVSRNLDAWNARVALAEKIGARVITDLKTAAAFPGDHPLCVGAPSQLLPGSIQIEAIKAADLILALDWVDLAGAFKTAGINSTSEKTIIKVSADHHIHKGWSMDYQGLPPVDVMLSADPEYVVPDLLAAVAGAKPRAPVAVVAAPEEPKASDDKLRVEHLARELLKTVGDKPVCLTHLPLSWNGSWWPFRHPLDFVGADGGGGIGAGPGISVGAALALKGSGRLPIGICGDGDFLMGCTAVWTAVHYRIPLLLVIANNRSFFNDELHQERVARMRNRPVENRWVGQRISDPDPDLATIARGQGALGFGPISKIADLAPTFEKAVAALEAGQVVLVDVHVEPGYTAATQAAMTRANP